MKEIKLKPGERIDQLFSHQIKIIQANDVFSFSLDAVLLAHFANPLRKKSGKIVDLCAGNGAVSLFLTPKTNAHITAVELQPRLAEMAERSVALNNLEEQISVVCHDVTDIFAIIKKDSIDTVCVNPPYFAVSEHSQKNPNQHLALARHEIALTLPQVLSAMSGLLKQNARGYMVHRPERLDEILALAQQNRLAAKKMWFIHPKVGKEANIVLIEFIKDGKAGGVKVLSPLFVYGDDNEYSPQVKAILGLN